MSERPMRPTGPDGRQQVGAYRIDGLIGSGAMGAVHLATDTRLGRQVAIKLLSGHLGREPEFLARFTREAALLGRLDSPHVIPIYDHGRTGDRPYLVMQYAAGGDLGQALLRHGPMPVGLAAEVCAQVADGLAVAHDVGVVHRDVKPANVLLRDNRLDRPHVYLCDFGVAFTEPTGLTRTGAIAGTWNYLAPERTQGDPGSPASDLYAVGCLLHELLTGRPPYTGSDVEVAMAHLEAPVPRLSRLGPGTDRVNEILARTLAKDPASRFASARDLRDTLRTLAPPSVHGVMSRDRRRRGRWMPLTAGAAALVIVAGGLLVWHGHQDPERSPISSSTRSPSTPPPSSASSSPTPPAKPKVAITGDIDGDGHGDLLAVDPQGIYTQADGFYTWRNGAPVVGDIPAYAKKAQCTADTDADGRLDFLSVDDIGFGKTYQVTVAHAGRAPTKVGFSMPADRDYTLLCGDFTGDGRAEFALWSVPSDEDGPQDFSIRVVRQRADRTWTPARQWLDAPSSMEFPGQRMVTVADVNGDGKDDIVAETADHGPLSVWTSTGTGFRPAPSLNVGDLSDLGLTAGDLDGDGRDEIIVGRLDPDPLVAVWDLRGGRWQRTRWRVGGRDFWSAGLGVSDVNGDGKDDLIAIGSISPSYLAISGGTKFASITKLSITVPGSGEDVPIGRSPNRVN